jgi:hypothetical protein
LDVEPAPRKEVPFASAPPGLFSFVLLDSGADPVTPTTDGDRRATRHSREVHDANRGDRIAFFGMRREPRSIV